MRRIDAHHHLWRYSPAEFEWLDESMAALRRDFQLPDLHAALQSAAVDGTVVVQARQTIEETRWLLQLAREDDTLLGVVGWLPLADPSFPALLEALQGDPLLKGLRHVVQAEPSGFLDGAAFNAGVRRMRGTGLVYDLLIQSTQLEEATRFVDRHPGQPFVLDHLGKPPIRAGEMAGWSRAFRELARRDHVTCKLSGMVTEADWTHWSPASLQPYFQAALEAFGPSRLMLGSDWPVLTLACPYGKWWRMVEDWIAPLTASERQQILGGVATNVYRLQTQGEP